MTESPPTIDQSEECVRPMRADARRNQEKVLAAAHLAIAEHGADASLDDIARQAGVGPGTLYRHFPTREDLLMAVMRSTFVDLHARAEELLLVDDPVAGLSSYIQAWIKQNGTYKGVAAQCMRISLESDRPWTSSCRLAQDDLQQLMQRAQSSGHIRQDVTEKELWRLLNGLTIGIRDASYSTEEAEVLLDVIIQGLRTSPAAIS